MRLLLAILLILLILPQTSFDNVMIRRFNETGLFANYGEAKAVVTIATWGCLVCFLVLNIWLSL